MATNNRVLRPYHGGATTTTATVNGVDAGGLMTANINIGFDGIITTPHDGNAFPNTDRLTEFCRGSMVSQDWIECLNVLNGTEGSWVFYERESGAATVVVHTLSTMVIENVSVNLQHRGYATASFNWECFAATPATQGFVEMWARLAAQTAPAAITDTARGLEITALTHGGATVEQITGLSFNIGGTISKASHDGDQSYNVVERIQGGVPVSGTLTTQDLGAAIGLLDASGLADDIVVTVKQSQAATAKTLTILDAQFTNLSTTSDTTSSGYTEYSLDFVCNGNALTTATAVTIA